jgi:hypothetical protein
MSWAVATTDEQGSWGAPKPRETAIDDLTLGSAYSTLETEAQLAVAKEAAHVLLKGIITPRVRVYLGGHHHTGGPDSESAASTISVQVAEVPE